MLKVLLGLTGMTLKNGFHKSTPIIMQRASLSTKQDSNDTSKQESSDTSDSQTHEETTSDEEKFYVDDIKNKILSASLDFVKDEGWTKEALGKGAKSLGYAPTVHSIFPHGPAHLVTFFTVTCNTQLAEKMEKNVAVMPNGVLNPIKFIEDSIITRIEMVEPYKSNWSSALAIILNSQMVLEHAAAMLKLSDDICYFAGDRSVNSSWYARRAVVAGVYQASELHWLGGGKNTREFTSTQLNMASNLEALPKNISALLTVARNILPINIGR